MVGNFKGNAILTGPRNQLYRRPPEKNRKNTDSLPFLFRVQPILESRSQVVLKSLKSSIFYSQFFSERFCAPLLYAGKNSLPSPQFSVWKVITPVTLPPTGSPPHPKKTRSKKLFTPTRRPNEAPNCCPFPDPHDTKPHCHSRGAPGVLQSALQCTPEKVVKIM